MPNMPNVVARETPGIKRTAAAACLLMLVVCTPLWAQEIRLLETYSVPSEAAPAPATISHTLRLTLYGFAGTRWQRSEIVEAVHGAARLLAQCGVVLEHVELRALDAPRSYHFYSTAVSRELVRSMAAVKPAVFFVEDTKNEPAFDAEAIALANSASRPELAHTIWIAYGARDLPLALAHELVHVLADSGEHSDALRNLMRAETSAENTQLSNAQCERLRLRGEAQGLLKSR